MGMFNGCSRRLAYGLATLAASSLVALPARAHVVEEAYRDVPGRHWAADAVAEMSIRRVLMKGFDDNTFRGEAAFSRADLAWALEDLVQELELLSKTAWTLEKSREQTFIDLRGSEAKTAGILKLANRYGLWVGVPGIEGDRFHPEAQVTRAEIAMVVRNLLAVGEARGVVLPRDPRSPDNPFKDVRESEWAFHAILEDNQRYRVMVGFPDITFRPDGLLDRFQFAAIGSASFGMIRELIRRSAVERAALTEKTRTDRFLERLAVQGGAAVGRASTPIDSLAMDLLLRAAVYPSELGPLGKWFGYVDASIGLSPVAGGFSLLAGTGPQGALLDDVLGGKLQLQPYAGLRVSRSVDMSLALPTLGGFAYWRREALGLQVQTDLAPLEVAGPAVGLLAAAGFQADWRLSDQFAIVGGVQWENRPGIGILRGLIGTQAKAW
ncbi:MAG: S-layer homology domain-containing protein [Candidatus Sericytochromatia bacterium]|nr:S-layer homology domain-containing protein [Candidatus Tanganyikabacteria bacterium]